MRTKIMKLFILLGLLFVVIACSEEVEQMPLESNNIAPEPVSDLNVENLPGKVKLTFTLPKDQDLLYVKANYILPTGREMEVKSSLYSNSMTLQGFTGNDDVVVDVVAVNRSEVESEPVSINVNPLPSPIFDVYKSLNVGSAFGGIFVNASNPQREDLAILILTKNDEGDYVADPNSVYTSTDNIRRTVRGYDTISKEFAFTIRDRWLNYTDTLVTSITPLFEQAIPKSSYGDLRLPNDAPGHNSTPKSGMWDNDIINWPRCYLTQGNFIADTHITSFDIGVLTKLSRIVIWDYPEYFNSGNGTGRAYYYNVCMKEFKIYGSAELETTGDLDKWTLLGTYKQIKPSGLPYGQSTGEDFETANAGFSWDIDASAEPVRYIRIEMIDNWAGTYAMGISELQVYGNTEF
ncbi:MAG: galactose-binding protein [Flavobacteriaceae bacterium]|nr:galactose-binding protein [Flavobacteriaceae bacterium]|tara:strand:+ start:5988 stop:7205 length:1218 start_codon:yes stop_codon:yes gene_type:complete